MGKGAARLCQRVKAVKVETYIYLSFRKTVILLPMP